MTTLSNLREANYLPVVYTGNTASISSNVSASRAEARRIIDDIHNRLSDTISGKLLAAYYILLALPATIEPYSARKRYPVAVLWEDFRTNSQIRLNKYVSGDQFFFPDVVYYNGKYYDYRQAYTGDQDNPETVAFADLPNSNPPDHPSNSAIFVENPNYTAPVVSFGAQQFAAVRTVDQRKGEIPPSNEDYWDEIEDLREYFGLDATSYVFTLVNKYGEESRPSRPTATLLFNVGEYLRLNHLPTLAQGRTDYKGILEFCLPLDGLYQVLIGGAIHIRRMNTFANSVNSANYTARTGAAGFASSTGGTAENSQKYWAKPELDESDLNNPKKFTVEDDGVRKVVLGASAGGTQTFSLAGDTPAGYWIRGYDISASQRNANNITLTSSLDFYRKDGSTITKRALNQLINYAPNREFLSGDAPPAVAGWTYPSSGFAAWMRALPIIYTNTDDIHTIGSDANAGQYLLIKNNQLVSPAGDTLYLLNTGVVVGASIQSAQSAGNNERLTTFTISSYGSVPETLGRTQDNTSLSNVGPTAFCPFGLPGLGQLRRNNLGFYTNYGLTLRRETRTSHNDNRVSLRCDYHVGGLGSGNYLPVSGLTYSSEPAGGELGFGSFVKSGDRVFRISGRDRTANYWELTELDVVVTNFETRVLELGVINRLNGKLDDLNIAGTISVDRGGETYVLSGDNKIADYQGFLEDGSSANIVRQPSADDLGEFLRIYRFSTRQGGFILVGEVRTNIQYFSDYIPPGYETELPFLRTSNFLSPPENITGHLFTSQGRYLVASRNRVYISPVGVSHAFIQDVVFPCNEVMGFIDTAQAIIVVTDNRPFAMVIRDGEDGLQVAIEPIDAPYPCVSSGSVVDMGEFGIYASHEGLVAVGSGYLGIITAEIFTERQWKKLDPAGIKGIRFNDYYLGCSDECCFLFNPVLRYFTFVDDFSTPYYSIADGNVYVGKKEEAAPRILLVTTVARIYSVAGDNVEDTGVNVPVPWTPRALSSDPSNSNLFYLGTRDMVVWDANTNRITSNFIEPFNRTIWGLAVSDEYIYALLANGSIQRMTKSDPSVIVQVKTGTTLYGGGLGINSGYLIEGGRLAGDNSIILAHPINSDGTLGTAVEILNKNTPPSVANISFNDDNDIMIFSSAGVIKISNWKAVADGVSGATVTQTAATVGGVPQNTTGATNGRLIDKALYGFARGSSYVDGGYGGATWVSPVIIDREYNEIRVKYSNIGGGIRKPSARLYDEAGGLIAELPPIINGERSKIPLPKFAEETGYYRKYYIEIKNISEELYEIELSGSAQKITLTNFPDGGYVSGFQSFSGGMSLALPSARRGPVAQYVKNFLPLAGIVKGRDEPSGNILGIKYTAAKPNPIFFNPIDAKWYYLPGEKPILSTTSFDAYSRLYFINGDVYFIDLNDLAGADVVRGHNIVVENGEVRITGFASSGAASDTVIGGLVGFKNSSHNNILDGEVATAVVKYQWNSRAEILNAANR